MIELRSYEPSLKVDAIELIGQGDYKTAIWDWQFRQQGEFAPIVAVQQDRAVGFNGVMPVHIWSNNKEHAGIWSCDFYVSEQSRGQGVGTLIKDKLIQFPCRFIMSLGISDNAHRILLAKGWQPISGVRVHRRRFKMTGMSQLPYFVAQALNKVRYFHLRKASFDVVLQDILPAKEQLDRLWQEVKVGYSACVVRNAAYLKWRYAGHPLGSYKYCIAENAQGLAGLLVYKQEAGVVRIVDYVGPARDFDVKKSLLKKILNRLDRSVSSIVFTVSDTQWSKVLFSSGFYSSHGHERFVVLDKNKSTEPLCWFVTGGDSDGDIIQTALYSINASK